MRSIPLKRMEPMLYNQPLASRFGAELKTAIDPERWDELSIAVAWVRESGIRHVEEVLRDFLTAGKQVRIISGIAMRHTSYEGLSRLLNLAEHGDIKTFVYHNESGAIFHPKLYLFRSANSARLIVGSNNLTAAGLYSNVEAGLSIDIASDDPRFLSAYDAFCSWQDTSTGLSKELDKKLLDRKSVV